MINKKQGGKCRRPLPALLIACVLIAGTMAALTHFSDALDGVVLLEKRNPGYWDMLRVRDSDEHKVLRTTADDRSGSNLLTETAASKKRDQYSVIMNPDGSVTFTGRNTSGKDIYLMLSDQKLDDGVYYYSDRKDENTPEPSGGEIRTMLRGVAFEIGGETRNVFKVDMASSDTDGSFTADSSSASRYQAVLVIGRDYENEEGITFYPMISRESADRYAPAVSLNADLPDDDEIASEAEENGGESDYYTYGQIEFGRDEIADFTAEDWSIFVRSAKGGAGLDWISVQLDDGWGVQADSGGAVFGRLDALGRVAASSGNDSETLSSGASEQQTFSASANTYAELTEAAERAYAGADDADPRSIEDFSDYLARINRPEYSILIAVKEDGNASLGADDRKKLKALGLSAPFGRRTADDGTEISMFRKSFAAVIDGGEVIFEDTGEDEHPVESEGALGDGSAYEIQSVGWDVLLAEDQSHDCRICVNGLEYSMNRRGINIVLYDRGTKSVVDSVCFDAGDHLKASRTSGAPVGIPEESETEN